MAQATGRSGTMPPRSTTGRGYTPGIGWVLFAGIMMVANGILSILEGVVGVTRGNRVFAVAPNYTYKFDLTSWGWIHIALGALVALIGFGVIAGQRWARYAGIAVVALSLIANFLFLPYYPLWALVVIAIDVFVLWALCTYRRGDLPGSDGGGGGGGRGAHAAAGSGGSAGSMTGGTAENTMGGRSGGTTGGWQDSAGGGSAGTRPPSGT